MEPIIFSLPSANYFTNKQKSPGGDYLLSPAGVDWLKSSEKLDNLLTRPDNRGSSRRIPKQLHLRRELPSFRQRTLQLGLLLRNGRTDPLRLRPETLCQRRRIVARAILSAFVRLLLGYARSFTVDVGLVIEAQTEDELPERLIGAVRMCHVELASAFVVQPLASEPQNGKFSYGYASKLGIDRIWKTVLRLGSTVSKEKSLVYLESLMLMHIIIRTVNFSSQKIVTLETLTQRRLQLFLLEIPELLYIEVETAMLLRFVISHEIKTANIKASDISSTHASSSQEANQWQRAVSNDSDHKISAKETNQDHTAVHSVLDRKAENESLNQKPTAARSSQDLGRLNSKANCRSQRLRDHTSMIDM
ncbi:hypothetical protein DY000_02011340 [Brassica cretica]|uniref:Protein ENHANCED DISEASE RESISTANCE 2 C-terminal domain-containing protein n=1 Tax=Brassica cretica TaxID=69181 RepID=A0ABQ7DBX7_BRACR|nr:hypothetical protein DY000_02011340 [Brassica cretica]